MKMFKRMALSATVALGLVACGGSDAPSSASRRRAPEPTTAKVAPAAEAAAPKTAATAATSAASALYVYSYNPVAKRDPFRSPLEDLMRVSNDNIQSSCADPLCQWDLDQLKLVAVVTGDSNPLAMVEDPLGRGHVVRRNARMGKQGGKVTQILRDSVTVTESFPGTDGKLISNPVSLQLSAEERKEAAYNLLTGKNWE